MIYSLTIAPCIDYNLNLEDKELRVGGVNRPKAEGFSLGGKGITVSRMLRNLHVDNIPIVAVGGKIGRDIKTIVNREFAHHVYLQTESNSRLNVMITGPHQDTRFDPSAPKVKDSEIEEGLTAQVIAIDGIAVIVNPENAVSALTGEQIKNIFIGAVTSWKDIA